MVPLVLKSWESSPAEEFPNDAAGFWVPDEYQILISKDGRSWFSPAPKEEEAVNPTVLVELQLDYNLERSKKSCSIAGRSEYNLM